MKHGYESLVSRYAGFPASVQVLNVVSDLQKADHLAETGRDASRNHLYRALVLLDAMASDPKWAGRLRELRRLREAAASLLCGEPYGTIGQVRDAALQLNRDAYRRLVEK